MRKILFGGALVALAWAPPAFSQVTQDFYDYLGGATTGSETLPFIGSTADGATFIGWTSGAAMTTGGSGSSEPSSGNGSSQAPQAASAGGEALTAEAMALAAVRGSTTSGAP
jgi:hypothetical protein